MAMAHAEARHSNVRESVIPQRETHFSWLSTRMSTERTLMSWVRTSSALIAFGFTISQLFDRFNGSTGAAAHVRLPMVRTLPLAMIAIGTIAIMIAAREYRDTVHYLWSFE